MTNIQVGIGSCLTGKPVRYNGDHKRTNPHIAALSDHVKLVPICPEVGIGLGVPRETIRLVVEGDTTRLKNSSTQTIDHTDAMHDLGEQMTPLIKQLSGYIFVKGSPSCGLERVSRYNEKGNFKDQKGIGIFAEKLLEIEPLLPVEEDGRLHDPLLRERFIVQVYTWQAWKELIKDDYSIKDLIQFWAKSKYLIMSRHYPSYKKIGQLLAQPNKESPAETAQQLITLIMSALKILPSRKAHTNVLQHMKGYLKNKLSQTESKDIDEKIEQYRLHRVPLIVPMSLLQHQFKEHPHPYIEQQVFMSPYPEQLGLRNNI